MKVAVIGGGWAGLAAAIKLHQKGLDTTVFESARYIGGRARPIITPLFPSTIDNGQHILIGAYKSCFDLMRSLNIDIDQVLFKQTMEINSLDQALRFKFLGLRSPFNRLGALFNSHGICGLQGRILLIKIFKSLQDINLLKEMPVLEWLKSLNCPEKLITDFWQPLCIATTNTDISVASTKIFARVLRDGLLGSSQDSNIYIPRKSLHDLWPAKVADIMGDKIKHQFIRQISQNNDKSWKIGEQNFNQIILATPANISRKLITPLSGSQDYLSSWPEYRFSAIGTVNLLLEKPWHSKRPMYLLKDKPANNAWGQWLFDRSRTAASSTQHNLLHIVIGNAQRYTGVDVEIIKQGVIRQIEQQAEKPLPKVLKHLLVTEKRATFDSLAGLKRPATSTPWTGLFLAGDWVETHYPAVLEGAVASGFKAASMVLDEIKI